MKKTNLLLVAVLVGSFLFVQEARSQATQSQGANPKNQQDVTKRGELTKVTPPNAEYDLNLMSKKIRTLETLVATLQKQTESLVQQNNALQALVKTQGNTSNTKFAEVSTKLNSLDGRLKQLDSTFQTHAHHMPSIGEQALSAIPGMQAIANAAGVGSVKPQWENIRILFLNQYSKGISLTGPPYKQD